VIHNMSDSLKILSVEDDPVDAQLIVDTLRREGIVCEIVRVETEGEFRRTLAEHEFDIILSDHSLPGFDGLAALRLAQEMRPYIPFLLVSGTLGEEVAIETLKSGATDYVLKQRLSRLAPSVRRALQEAQERNERKRAEEALVDSENRFRTYVENAPSGILVMDLNGRTVDANPATSAMTGYSLAELLSMSLWDLVPHSTIDEAKQAFTVMGRAGRFNGELRLKRRDGSECFISCAAVRFADNGYLAFFQDITARKMAEEETRRHLKRLSALYRVERALGSSLDVRFTLNVLLDQVIENLGMAAVDVLLIQEADTELNMVASRGFGDESSLSTRVRLGEGCVGKAALERRLVCTETPCADPSCSRWLAVKDLGLTSHIAIPMIAKGQLKGVLEIFDYQLHSNDGLLLEFLETLAGQAAIAIDNAAMFANVQRANAEILMSYDATINGWVSMLELRDLETKGHSQRVTELTVELCRLMGVPEGDMIHVRRGALLHDVGKMAIPDSILLKPGALNPDETTVMRTHVEIAHKMLAKIPFLRPALDIPSGHHEKWDGTGYPTGLRATQIPLSARVFAIIDVWDALTSDRPYREAWTPDRTLAFVQEQSGKHFDPDVVEAFTNLIRSKDILGAQNTMAS